MDSPKGVGKKFLKYSEICSILNFGGAGGGGGSPERKPQYIQQYSIEPPHQKSYSTSPLKRHPPPTQAYHAPESSYPKQSGASPVQQQPPHFRVTGKAPRKPVAPAQERSSALPDISKTPHRAGSPVEAAKPERQTSKRSVSSSGGGLGRPGFISSTTTTIRKMITPYTRPPETAGPSSRSVLPQVEAISGAHSRIVELVSCSVSSSKAGLPQPVEDPGAAGDVFAIGSGLASVPSEPDRKTLSPTRGGGGAGTVATAGGADIFERQDED